MDTAPLISVVIPVLDDAPALGVRLAELGPAAEGAAAAVEVVIVDGAATESVAMTDLRAACPAARWLRSGAGRARQMNAGAAVARGRWLLFLHADTRLDAGWAAAIERLDRDGRTAWGAFRFALDSADWRARIIEWGVARRTRRLRLPFGDQALFVRRDLFEALGGFADLPLMEDLDLVRRLARRRPPSWLPLRATSSPRRWLHDGWVRRSARNVVLQLLYFAGVPPARLAAHYGAKPGHRPPGAPGHAPHDESL
ncbi:MAG: TIGR04283 family arsenosugar biosynthesis glycosyltransferase [Acidobacteriota bacterium]|nr:TIGR04283 family arsenosugar biosynthesis glycosyltransferase [Acidobacteriota bacterium]